MNFFIFKMLQQVNKKIFDNISKAHVSLRADPGWSVRGGIEAKIGRKWSNFARFWPILEGTAPPSSLLDPPLSLTV